MEEDKRTDTVAINDTQHYFSFVVDENFDVAINIDAVATLIFVAFIIVVILFWLTRGFKIGRRVKSFEIDQAEFGLGEHKLTLRPNETDRQIAYQIWVELSTRKIGLPLDLENDVISEVYDSWYNFFSVTRELVKVVPVSKFRRTDTQKIIHLSIEVLNTGIRPHLTKWQARFRRWYNKMIADDVFVDLTPQEIQTKYPDYEELTSSILDVNKKLIKYREKLYELVQEI